MSLAHLAPANIRSLSPYLPGKPITELAREMGMSPERIVKLASNENPLGMSPKARAAATQVLGDVARYPDTFELTHAVAAHVGVTPEQVVLGNGSNDVLDLAARVFLTPGCSALVSAHAFAVYPLATLGAGATCITVAATADYGHDLAAMRAAIRPDTRIVWIANPNNPTGTFLPHPELRAFIAALPAHVVVVLDEAYNEYLDVAEEDTVAWLRTFPQLVITRTFSKIYGLAGLRVGYALASEEIADLMNRVRQPFNVNNLALAAAVAALSDHDFVVKSRALNQRGMAQLREGLAHLELAYLPSQGNFLTFALPGTATDAQNIHQALLRQGVIVRPLAGYQMPQHLRVTVGLESENARFLTALHAALRDLSDKSGAVPLSENKV